MNLASNIRFGLLAILALVMLSGCYNDKSKRNIEFAPNMYNSLPLEPYSQTMYHEDSELGGNYAASSPRGKVSFLPQGTNAQKAPEGTLPRSSDSWYRQESYEPYHIPNTPEGYELAATEVSSPLDNPETNENGQNCSSETYERGKVVYEKFCIMCHGPNGQGQGSLVTGGAYAGVPAYNSPALKNLSEGKMFHTLTYGKGIMGSYASQITPKERWEVICYIQHFQRQ